MRVILPILLVLTIAAAYALGRWGLGGAEPIPDSDLSTLASFRGSLEQGDVLERSYRYHAFLETLGPNNVEQASEIIDARNPWLVAGELVNFMIAWTSFDASAALEWALSRSGAFRGDAAAAAIYAWAFHDPVGARRALGSLDRAAVPKGLDEHLVAGWLHGGNHDGVIEYIESRPAGVKRKKFTNLLTIELLREGPEAVIRWVEAIPDDAPGSYKRTAFRKAASILASNDPLRASRWIETHLDRGYAERAPEAIGLRWVDVDPPAALAWLASLPRGSANDKALRNTFMRWLSEAPTVADTWVRSTAPAPGLDVVVQVMIARSRDDPPTAIDWTRRIFDQTERARGLVKLIRAWHRRDPEPAEHWLAESALPEKMKSAILNRSSVGRPGERGRLGSPDAAPPAPDARADPRPSRQPG